MEEASPSLLSCSKPHLEKLTLGITRILGEGTESQGKSSLGRGGLEKKRGGEVMCGVDGTTLDPAYEQASLL